MCFCRLLRCSDLNDDTLVQTGVELSKRQAQQDKGGFAKPEQASADASTESRQVGGPGGPILCLLLDFRLPPSAYATMLIREITRQGTSRTTQAGLTQVARERQVVRDRE